MVNKCCRVFRHRAFAGTIVALLMALAIILVIFSFLSPLFKMKIFQTDKNIVLQNYISEAKLYFNKGSVKDMFAKEVWHESPYEYPEFDRQEDKDYGIFFRRCPSLYDDFKLAMGLSVTSVVFGFIAFVLACLSTCYPATGRWRWSAMAGSLIATLAMIGILIPPNIIFLRIYNDEKYCFYETLNPPPEETAGPTTTRVASSTASPTTAAPTGGKRDFLAMNLPMSRHSSVNELVDNDSIITTVNEAPDDKENILHSSVTNKPRRVLKWGLAGNDGAAPIAGKCEEPEEEEEAKGASPTCGGNGSKKQQQKEHKGEAVADGVIAVPTESLPLQPPPPPMMLVADAAVVSAIPSADEVKATGAAAARSFQGIAFTNPADVFTTSPLQRNDEFYRILAPPLQVLYRSYRSEEAQWNLRQEVALGILGQAEVREPKQSHGIRLLFAGWLMSMLAFVLGFVWLMLAFCFSKTCGVTKGDPFGDT